VGGGGQLLTDFLGAVVALPEAAAVAVDGVGEVVAALTSGVLGEKGRAASEEDGADGGSLGTHGLGDAVLVLVVGELAGGGADDVLGCGEEGSFEEPFDHGGEFSACHGVSLAMRRRSWW